MSYRLMPWALAEASAVSYSSNLIDKRTDEKFVHY